MVEKIQPVAPVYRTSNNCNRPKDNQPQPQKKKNTVVPSEGSPNFLEDDLLRREFASPHFDKRV